MTHAYHEGRLSALGGHDHWENPHADGTSARRDHAAWYAGWCKGVQEMQQRIELIEPREPTVAPKVCCGLPRNCAHPCVHRGEQAIKDQVRDYTRLLEEVNASNLGDYQRAVEDIIKDLKERFQ